MATMCEHCDLFRSLCNELNMLEDSDFRSLFVQRRKREQPCSPSLSHTLIYDRGCVVMTQLLYR